jgi:hypothetical protein
MDVARGPRCILRTTPSGVGITTSAVTGAVIGDVGAASP